MFASLGDIVFAGAKSFSEMQDVQEESFAELPFLLDKPGLQKTGSLLDTYSLNMFFHAMFCNPEESISAIKTKAKAGAVLPLILGTGELLGNFVILKVVRNRGFSLGDGTIIGAGLDVELKEMKTASVVNAKKASAVKSGIAISDNKPVIIASVPVAPIPTAQAANNFSIATVQATAAISLWEAKKNATATLRATATRLRQIALKIDNSVAVVLSTIDNDPASELYLQTRDLSQTLSAILNDSADIQDGCSNVITAIDNNNTTGLVAAVANLTTDVSSLKSNSKQSVADAANLIAMYNSKIFA